MKIAIFSSYAYICKVNNYGSILQYFALQTYLKQLGHAPYWIQYRPNENKHNGISKCLRKLILKSNVQNDSIKHYNQKGFKNFIEQYISLSQEVYYNYNEIRKRPPQADLYIVGSDQIWNGFSPERYLMFVPKNRTKISYAVSFGRSSIRSYLKPLLRIYLKNFEAISVRELNGLEICHSVGRDDAQYVVDPSFLLSKEQYENILDSSNTPTIQGDYIFGYFVNPFINNVCPYFNEINNLSNETHCKLIITAIQNAEKAFTGSQCTNPSPLEWLQLIRKAKYIITNSFHGIAYSIIFQKQFILVPQKGGMSDQNCRYFNLLKKLGLDTRIYNHKSSIKSQLEIPIKWENVLLKEEEFIHTSKEYLLHHLRK